MGLPCEEGRSRSIFWQRWTAAWWDSGWIFTVWRRSIWRGTVWRGLRCGGGPKRAATLVMEAEYGADFAVPLLPEQQERAEAFAVRLSER